MPVFSAAEESVCGLFREVKSKGGLADGWKYYVADFHLKLHFFRFISVLLMIIYSRSVSESPCEPALSDTGPLS